MAKITGFFQIIWGFLKMIRNPKDISPIFRVKRFLNHPAVRLCIAKTKSDPATAALFQERYRPREKVDLQKLALLPAGTFGHEFATHMLKNGLDVEFYPPELDRDTCDDLAYMRRRGRETHDMWHVALGYEADEEGEMEISAFYVAQLYSPLNAFLLALGFIVTTIKKPELYDKLMESIIRGWTMGKKAKPLFAVKWEENFERPLVELRRELNIENPTWEKASA